MSIRRANSPFMTADEVQADPVERLAAHLYETEPGPPGPSDPPYGSDQTPIVERRRYRAKALRMLASDAMLEALEAAIACGLIPKSTAKDGGPSARSEQVRVADMIRDAVAKAKGQTP